MWDSETRRAEGKMTMYTLNEDSIELFPIVFDDDGKIAKYYDMTINLLGSSEGVNPRVSYVKSVDNSIYAGISGIFRGNFANRGMRFAGKFIDDSHAWSIPPMDYVTINYKNGDDVVVGRLKIITLAYNFCSGVPSGAEDINMVIVGKTVLRTSDVYATITDTSLAPEYPLPWKVQLKNYALSEINNPYSTYYNSYPSAKVSNAIWACEDIVNFVHDFYA
jgi:hypothetical protein